MKRHTFEKKKIMIFKALKKKQANSLIISYFNIYHCIYTITLLSKNK